MTPAHDQHEHQRVAGRRSGDASCAAANALQLSAAHDKAQNRVRMCPGRVRRRYLLAPDAGLLPVTTRPGLRARPLSRVGWCFNTARDFLEFHALTRAGIRPDHAGALLSFNPGHHVLQDLADVPECHVDLSRAAGFDNQQRREDDLEPCSLSRGIEFPR